MYRGCIWDNGKEIMVIFRVLDSCWMWRLSGCYFRGEVWLSKFCSYSFWGIIFITFRRSDADELKVFFSGRHCVRSTMESGWFSFRWYFRNRLAGDYLQIHELSGEEMANCFSVNSEENVSLTFDLIFICYSAMGDPLWSIFNWIIKLFMWRFSYVILPLNAFTSRIP